VKKDTQLFQQGRKTSKFVNYSSTDVLTFAFSLKPWLELPENENVVETGFHLFFTCWKFKLTCESLATFFLSLKALIEQSKLLSATIESF
jgi:hypothetical protein